MISLPVVESSQVGAARRKALHEAEAIGLSADDRDRLALVVTEAATNLVRHARGGEIFLLPCAEGKSARIEVLVVDDGPGLSDVATAMTDGFTTAAAGERGLGGGLGAIARMSDAFDIYSDAKGTTLAITIGKLDANPEGSVEAAGLIVPKPNFSEGGDAFGLRPEARHTMIMLMDVLGHGPAAAIEAKKGVGAFAQSKGASLEETVGAVSAALSGGRGAAALFVEVPHAGDRLRAMSLGNVRGEILSPGGAQHGIPSTPGIVGARAKPPRVTEHEWPAEAMLLLSTDGLRGGGRQSEPASLFFREPITIAATLYKRRRRGTDDSGIVVARARR